MMISHPLQSKSDLNMEVEGDDKSGSGFEQDDDLSDQFNGRFMGVKGSLARQSQEDQSSEQLLMPPDSSASELNY